MAQHLYFLAFDGCFHDLFREQVFRQPFYGRYDVIVPHTVSFKVGRTDDSHKAAPPVDIEYPGFPFGEFLKSLPVLRCIYLFESDMVVHIYRDRFHAVMGGRIFDEERQFTVFSLVHDMPSAVIEQEARVLHAAENVCVVRDA